MLITGEYLVIKGALALAVPVRLGQDLKITKTGNQSNLLIWKTYVKSELWMEAVFDISNLAIISTDRPSNATYILQLLKAGMQMGSSVFSTSETYLVESFLEFPLEWGLGSSSSLISNLAWWMDIDAFELLRFVSNGSGYDVACARSQSPILYRIVNGQPEISEIIYTPPFSNNIYFIYLGKKQDTAKIINQNLHFLHEKDKEIQIISELTKSIYKTDSLKEFNQIIIDHENLIGKVIRQTPVKKEFFPDFGGEMKSLGAWGGDFIMATWEKSENELFNYFNGKNLNIIFRWDDLVLNVSNKDYYSK